MARKYELLSEMYDKTTKTMTNPVVWRHFLESACRNYRLRFDEQLLVFAQRPDATAVLEIERWNKQFGRWVNWEPTVSPYLRTRSAILSD